MVVEVMLVYFIMKKTKQRKYNSKNSNDLVGIKCEIILLLM